MNSKERVKAALHFNKPDKVPTFNLIAGDVFPVPVIFSKEWKPGWNDGEENLFPHVRVGSIMKASVANSPGSAGNIVASITWIMNRPSKA